jgi:drug/metabolite transporter (DMT)-like permease
MVETLVRGSSAPWAVAALLVNAFLWGVSWWPFRALQTHGLHPLWATGLMYAVIAVCVLCMRPGVVQRCAQHPALWWLAIASGLTNICFNWAVTIGDVVRVVLLFYLMPAWAVLLAWPILGEKPTLASVLRLSLALAGVLLVLKHPDAAWPIPTSLPDYLALAGGVSFALTNIMLRKLQAAPSEACMLSMFGGGAVLAACVALWGTSAGWVPGVPEPLVSWLLLALGLALALFASNLALQYGAARLRSATTSLVMLSEIVFATLSSVWLGAATLEPRTLMGGVLILAAAAWAALAESATAD